MILRAPLGMKFKPTPLMYVRCRAFIGKSEYPIEESIVQQYRCIVCNYIYDPAVGDIERGVPSGTLFENLPDDWVCPVCRAGKDMFEPVN
jgi:rubredoxin